MAFILSTIRLDQYCSHGSFDGDRICCALPVSCLWILCFVLARLQDQDAALSWPARVRCHSPYRSTYPHARVRVDTAKMTTNLAKGLVQSK